MNLSLYMRCTNMFLRIDVSLNNNQSILVIERVYILPINSHQTLISALFSIMSLKWNIYIYQIIAKWAFAYWRLVYKMSYPIRNMHIHMNIVILRNQMPGHMTIAETFGLIKLLRMIAANSTGYTTVFQMHYVFTYFYNY